MSFIRPEIVAVARKWRECLVGGLAVGLGLYLGLTGTLAAKIISAGLVLGGVLLILAGIQRARFRKGSEGPGVVSLDEGRLSYFGPQDGGVLALADIASVDLITQGDGSHWSIEGASGEALLIPTNAAGADVLFDAFGALPGLDVAVVLQAVEAATPGRVLIWARARDHLALQSH